MIKITRENLRPLQIFCSLTIVMVSGCSVAEIEIECGPGLKLVDRVHVLEEGDSLESISAEYFGDPGYGDFIVDRNVQIRGMPFEKLTPGTALRVPVCEEVRTTKAGSNPASSGLGRVIVGVGAAAIVGGDSIRSPDSNDYTHDPGPSSD